MKSRMSKYTAFILWGVILAYGGLCFYLFYMQSIQPLDYNNRYFQSDLPYHISMIIDDGWYYSFTAYAYQLLYRLGGNGTVLIALFLAAASVLCVFLTERLLELLTGRKKPDALTLGCALALNLVMPFFWRFAGEYRYVSYQSGNIWHNSTYQCMKPAALAVMICYLKGLQGASYGQAVVCSGRAAGAVYGHQAQFSHGICACAGGEAAGGSVPEGFLSAGVSAGKHCAAGLRCGIVAEYGALWGGYRAWHCAVALVYFCPARQQDQGGSAVFHGVSAGGAVVFAQRASA